MTLRFRSDGTFRVLQFADVQDGPATNADTVRLITAAIDKAQPDLVVFTGDQIRGYDPAFIETFRLRRRDRPGSHIRLITAVEATLHRWGGLWRRRPCRDDTRAGRADGLTRLDMAGCDEHDHGAIIGEAPCRHARTDAAHGTRTCTHVMVTFRSTAAQEACRISSAATALPAHPMPAHPHGAMDRTRRLVRAAFVGFLSPVIRAGVPFAATYGNHDFQCGILPDEQDAIYREFPGCLNPTAPGGAYGNADVRHDAGDPADPPFLPLDASNDGCQHSPESQRDDGKPRDESAQRGRLTQETCRPQHDGDARRNEYGQRNPTPTNGAGRHDANNDGNPLACEPGTFALPIHSADGSCLAMAVIMVNSGDYEERVTPDPSPMAGGERPHALQCDLADCTGYGTPTPRAVRWLESVQHRLRLMNGGRAVPSIAFQHIPPQEFYDCLVEVPWWTTHAVDGSGPFSGRSYVLDRTALRPSERMDESREPNEVRERGELGEGISCPERDAGTVRALRKAGSYFALHCGHDHRNAFVSHPPSQGMDFGYSPTCGFASYGPAAAKRGARLFTFREDDPRSYATRILTWDELVGRRPRMRLSLEDLPFSAAAMRNLLRRPAVFVPLLAILGLGTGMALAALWRTVFPIRPGNA